MIKALLIDIDDTILDFDAYVRDAMKNGFAEFGLGEYIEEKYLTFERVNSGLWHAIEKGELTFNELKRIRWNRVFDALGIDFDGVRFEKYFRDFLFYSGIPMDGAGEMLEYLSGKYLICTASNGPYDQQIHRLQVADFYKYFKYNFISESVGASKPSEEFFSYCLTTLGLSAGEVMMIGDSPTSDMLGAYQSGIKTCYFDIKNKPLPEGVRVDHRVTKLFELRNIL